MITYYNIAGCSILYLDVGKSSVEDNIDNDYQSYDSIIKDYFQLDINLRQLYIEWSRADSNFAKIALSMPGIRILRQDPVENLFSFICSSNNNISRITSMVGNLCKTFGKK